MALFTTLIALLLQGNACSRHVWLGGSRAAKYRLMVPPVLPLEVPIASIALTGKGVALCWYSCSYV